MVFYKHVANVSYMEDDLTNELCKQICEDFTGYNKARPNTYRFVAECNRHQAVGVTVLDNDYDNFVAEAFPWGLAQVAAADVVDSEISSAEFCNLLQQAVEANLMTSEDVSVCLNSMRMVINVVRPRGIFSGANYYTEVVAPEAPDKQQFLQDVDVRMSDSLREEMNRIYDEQNSQKFLGHPVHYVFQRNSDHAKQNSIIKKLISALYANNRLLSRRYCCLEVDKISTRRLGNIDALYRCYAGGTIILQLPDVAPANCESFDEVSQAIAKNVLGHRFDVLTVVSIPALKSDLVKEFLNRLDGVLFVNIQDEKMGFDDAKQYLAQKAEHDDLQAFDSLYQGIKQEGRYAVSELDAMFDEWSKSILQRDFYPAYRSLACPAADEDYDAYQKLMSLVGLTEAKKIITRAVNFSKAQQLFADKGMKRNNISRHLVFCGSPGTAKTTVARLYAQIMKQNGVLPGGQLVECGRADLVGKFLGHTAQQVKDAFRRAKGGVLFIDEAYSLVDDRDGQYGDEAINTIVQEMENNRDDTVVIFAGYADKMQKFLDKNPGLRSRISFQVPFDDYTTEELLSITRHLAKGYGVQVSQEAMDTLRGIYVEAQKSNNFGNGRFVRNTIEQACLTQASRLLASDYDSLTEQDVMTIIPEDIELPTKVTVERKPIGFCA